MDELMKDHKTNATCVPLSAANLAALPAEILKPTYDRSAITPGIVHIGLGNFHRAHQAWYLHRLMQQGMALDWGIIGAGVRPYDEAQRLKLAEQDYLSTLIELDPSRTSAEVIGSMIGYVPVTDGHRALIEQMSDTAIRIVSLTVTEGGYYLDPATKKFDPGAPDIQYDATHLDSPRTAFGAILAALNARRVAGTGPFTCQSCDNLPGNGDILRSVMVGLAKLVDPDLAAWVEENVSFPNSMVDCIVPATGPAELALVRDMGIEDQAPVTHESFRQWVIEDAFCAGRPPWEAVGATLSDHVHSYEAMKLRILNGGHQIIAAPAELLGLTTIADAMETPLIKQMFRKIALREIAPHVPAVSGVSIDAYIDLLDQRFSNPAIHDTVRRVAYDGASRHSGAVLPVIRDAITKGTALDGLALSQALWAHMCAGTRENGTAIEANDPMWQDLSQSATAARTTPQAWLAQSHIYGAMAEDERFAQAFEGWHRQLSEHGVLATLQTYLDQ